MKKRTKITLRTTIYLTIVGLLTLTGVFYAANPSQRATVGKSVASPDVPMANPTPFAIVPGVVGVAAVPDTVLVTEFCNGNLSRIDCDGNVSLVATLPSPPPPATCVEKYMAVAPIQSAAAGFTPRDVFITQGDDIFKFSGGILTPFVIGFGCPLSDHSSVTFDHVGTFEFKMIVTCENGAVFKINGAGTVEFIALAAGFFLEGPAVVPLSFGPFGGQILAADDLNSVVVAISNTGVVTPNAFNWTAPDWLGAESVNVIPSEPCANCSGGAYFQAVFDANLVYKFPLTDFIGLGGGVLVNSEFGHGTAIVTFDGSNYVTTLFDSLPGNQEGASFVDCDIPSPTPTATPISSPTPTPTPTGTPTCGTAFVIGDLDAFVGNHVTFWGAQWWKKNHLSGGGVQSRTPASFKGFANCTNPNPPTCGGTWESDPGNSSHPPDTVPDDITVIVSSRVTKSGPVESGDIPMMVTIHVDPGYGPNPGHEGTGTVTSVVCQPARPHQPGPRAGNTRGALRSMLKALGLRH